MKEILPYDNLHVYVGDLKVGQETCIQPRNNRLLPQGGDYEDSVTSAVQQPSFS